jgi:hypothetical protein
MIGAIAGDVIGSVHEGAGTKTKDFPLFHTNIRQHIENEFGYRLSDRLDDIRDSYAFDVSCQGSVPQLSQGVALGYHITPRWGER